MASSLGIEFLEQAQEVANEKACKKREKKLDRVFQVFLVILGFILGVIAEHFGAVVDAVSSIFH